MINERLKSLYCYFCILSTLKFKITFVKNLMKNNPYIFQVLLLHSNDGLWKVCEIWMKGYYFDGQFLLIEMNMATLFFPNSFTCVLHHYKLKVHKLFIFNVCAIKNAISLCLVNMTFFNMTVFKYLMKKYPFMIYFQNA